MLLVISVIVLGVCLTASLVVNFLLFKAANLQFNRASVYEDWIAEFKNDVMKTFIELKLLDDRQIFQKDDEVGVVFQELLDVVQKLNDRTQESESAEGE